MGEPARSQRRRVRTRKPRQRVLVVDDDPSAGRALARVFERKGFLVDTVESYEQGLEAFHAGFFDLVIADWDLAAEPERKGDALFCALRERDWEVPMILLSGQLPVAGAGERAETLQSIMNYGAVKFVERGQGYDRVIKEAQDLLRRRDTAL